MNVFDQVYRGKFGMFLVENIVVSFGMTIGVSIPPRERCFGPWSPKIVVYPN